MSLVTLPLVGAIPALGRLPVWAVRSHRGADERCSTRGGEQHHVDERRGLHPAHGLDSDHGVLRGPIGDINPLLGRGCRSAVLPTRSPKLTYSPFSDPGGGTRDGGPRCWAVGPALRASLNIERRSPLHWLGRLRGGKGTKPLIRHGDLRNSIAVVREGDGVFVGVLRSAKSSGGGSLVNIAAVHEFGSRPIVVKITPKVRTFLHAAFRKAGLDEKSGDRPSTGVAVIRIPARPFLRPVFEKYGAQEEVAQRFVERVAKLLGGDFGR